MGNLGLVSMDKEDKPKILWELENKKKSEVVSIRTTDINLDGNRFKILIIYYILIGANEIILIRSNGDIDIYCTGQTIMDSYLFSTYNTKELLTGFDIGKFKYDENMEIIMTTYSGLMFSVIPRQEIPENRKINVDKKMVKVNIFIINRKILKS